MKLSNYAQGKDNNYNLIRIIAALAVLITHSFALSTGAVDSEPFRESLGMTMGSIAVDIFFIASGFLVTGSLLTRKSIIEFVWARVLRIFPALLIMLFLTIFLLGIAFTSLPVRAYLFNSTTYVYFLKCATLFGGIAFELPGVFENNPFRMQVNASLWTMPYEVRMYAFLAVIWIVVRFAGKLKEVAFEIIIVSGAVLSGGFILARHWWPYLFPQEGHFAQLFFMFFSGAAFYVLKERITLSSKLFWLFFGVICIAAAYNKHVFFVAYSLTISYMLFYVAYIPSGCIRKYNLIGDYSYGVYIYAFPIQQSIAALIPGVSIASMVFISLVVTLIFSVTSWHVIEYRALSLKKIFIEYTKKISFLGREMHSK